MDEGMFIGRRGVLGTLEARLAAARGEPAAGLVLLGPPGVGKTSLLERLRERRSPGAVVRLPWDALVRGWVLEHLARPRTAGAGRTEVVAIDEEPSQPVSPARRLAAWRELRAALPHLAWVLAAPSRSVAGLLAGEPGVEVLELDGLTGADAAVLAGVMLGAPGRPVDGRVLARILALAAGRPAYVRALGLRLALEAGDLDLPAVDAAFLREVLAPGGRIGARCRRTVEDPWLDELARAAVGWLARRGSQGASALADRLGCSSGAAEALGGRLEERGLVRSGGSGFELADPVLGFWLRFAPLAEGGDPAAGEGMRIAVQAFACRDGADAGPAGFESRVLTVVRRYPGALVPGAAFGSREAVRLPRLRELAVPLVWDAAGEVDGFANLVAADFLAADAEGGLLGIALRHGRPAEPADLGRAARLATRLAATSPVPLRPWLLAAEGLTEPAREYARAASLLVTEPRMLAGLELSELAQVA